MVVLDRRIALVPVRQEQRWRASRHWGGADPSAPAAKASVAAADSAVL
jgi:hypothetical protein